MSELTDFLMARIAEDELAASLVHSSVSEYHVGWTADGVFSPDSAQMGALWNGDRVMAECEAKRRIVDLHQPSEGPNYRGTECCARCTADGEYPADDDWTDAQNWPCPTLRALAAVYAGRPDYREDWRL